jgi:hypothetical protein
MNNRNTIQNELNELNSGLDSNLNNTPYSVPEGYFEDLAASVLAKIKGEQAVSASEEIAELSPLLAGISKKLPYKVPEGFFQSNLEDLEAFTSENEESLVLSFIDKQMPYEVPAGYFANLPEQVLEKVNPRSGKLVPMKRRWMRLAAAAMLTGLVALSGILYFNRSGNTGSTSKGPVPVAVELKKASTEELNEFIKNTAIDVNDNKAPVTAKNLPSKETKLFDDVSDKELEAFLSQMPTDDDELDIN